MDLRLGGPMDGIETVTRLRARHEFGLIYLTGGMDHQQKARADCTMPDAWLVKPYELSQLRRALEVAAPRGRVDDASG